MNNFTHSVSVAAVVQDESGLILTIRRMDNSEWQIPGGVLEKNETLEQCVVREVLEETGLIVEAVDLTGVYKHIGLGIVAFVFRCILKGGEFNKNSEVQEIKWMTLENVEKVFSKVFYERVIDGINNKYPLVKYHDGNEFIKI